MAADKVLTIHDWWDGPLVGLAEFGGGVVIYHRVFDVGLDEYIDDYDLTPVDEKTVRSIMDKSADIINIRISSPERDKFRRTARFSGTHKEGFEPVDMTVEWKKFVYADNAATTPVSEEVLRAMLPYLTEQYGNPSSIYSLGMNAARAVLAARKQVADVLGAGRVSEIFFTAGGSESDNQAIKGAAELGAKNGRRHIVTTNIEHHAVLNTCAYLEDRGFEVTYLPADENGFVTPQQVAEALREDTALVSVMAVNNEIGSIQPIAEIGKLCRERGVLFHTDAVQGIGHIDIDVQKMNIDMLSLSGHKLHAPKGVGALYVRSGIDLPSLIHGGAQERGKRAGTENVAGIVALGVAVTEAVKDIPEKNAALEKLRDRLIDGLLAAIPHSRLNGGREHRAAGNVNLSFRGIEGESLLLALDIKGIAASSGSACTSGSIDPSHVLRAIGLPDELAKGSLRLTLGDSNTAADVDYILEILPTVVKELRRRSPMWQRICREEGIEDYTLI